METHFLSYMNETDYDTLLLTRPGVKRGDFKVALRALNASRAWMKHVRSAGFEDVASNEPWRRILCWGPLAGCEFVPGGLQCRDDVGEVAEVNPSSLWVDERPYELMAMGMGDVFAGSYDADSWGGALPRRSKRRRRRSRTRRRS